MGFDLDRFVSEVGDDRKCTLCQGVLDNPVKTSCNHVFCSGCILPWVVRHGKCPKNCQKLSPSNLDNLLALRHVILNMLVRCDFKDRGCNQVVRLTDLVAHTQDCPNRPVQCRNAGCGCTVNSADLTGHEKDLCDYRPVGVCSKGCDLVLVHIKAKGHDCLDSVKNRVREQEMKIESLEQEMSRLISKYNKREKSLFTQIASLQHAVQIQAAKFHREVTDYRCQLAALLPCDSPPQPGDATSRMTVVLERDNGTLGFNIMGGLAPDNKLSEGIIVSRVTEGGCADSRGLRIHDHLLKVNGQDLSRSSHDEAVEAFRAAKEPIVVEVLRRVNKTKMKNRSPTMVSVATQTEEEIYSYPFQSPPSPPQVDLGYIASGLYEPSSRRPVAFSANTDMGLTDIEMANTVEFDDSYFDDRAFEMEYEEVILQRTSSEEKLGLTLCYGSVEDELTDIFISEIEPSSIAAADGRIREGDQILQINSVDVHSREQAISLFSEAKPHITLVVARPQLQLDDGFMDEHNELLDDPSVELLEKHHHDNMAFTSRILGQERLHFDEEGGTTDTATTENSHKHEKDSGVGRTDESTKNEESSEQEMMDNDSLPPHYRPETNLGNGEHHYSNESFTSNDIHDRELLANEISAEECNKFREVLENKCNSVGNSPRKTSSGKGSQSSLDQELALLNRQMEEIQLECEEIVESHYREQGKISNTPHEDGSKTESHRSPRVVPRMGTRNVLKHVQCQDPTELLWLRKDSSPSHRQPLPITQPGVHYPLSHSPLQDKEKDTSTTSAYNTGGESCRSTPLTLELNQVCDDKPGFRSSMLCLATAEISDPSFSDTEKQTQTLSPVKTRDYSSDGSMRSSQTAMNTALSNNVTPVQENGNILPPSESLGESLQDIYARYADVMYTNEANLQHTIAVQQKLFEQQISQKSGKLHRCGGVSPQLNSSPGSTLRLPKSRMSQQNSPGGESSTQMEWVVKRRPDGTRYITRRPVRNKMLKERAKKLAEERCGMTTDDDAMSELKVGRYWSKDDRKKHLEKARDQKRKKEQMIKQRMETLKEGEEKTNLNIVELSHRKMMKHKGKKVFDDFMTVQEMLAHGSKVPSGKTYNPLLSVTTV